MVEERRVVVVTGAGASTSLGKGGASVALMREFCEHLVSKLEEAQVGLSNVVNLDASLTGEAFERQLGLALKVADSLQVVRDFQYLGRTGNSNDQSPGVVQQWSKRAASRIDIFQNVLNEVLWSEFGPAVFDLREVETTYRRFLDHSRESFTGQIRWAFATTNYDLACESGLEAAGESPDVGGWKRSAMSNTMLEPERIPIWGTEATPVLHLHGAIGWYVTPEGVRMDPPGIPYQNGQSPAVLYPDPDKNPLDARGWGIHRIWRVLEALLADATHIVIVGHSLHDRPVLEAIATAMRKSSSTTKLAWSHREASANVDEMIRRIETELSGINAKRIERLAIDFASKSDFYHVGEFIGR